MLSPNPWKLRSVFEFKLASICLVLWIIFVSHIENAHATLKQLDVQRTIDLSSQSSNLVREVLTIDIQNIGNDPISNYVLYIPESKINNLIWTEVVLNDVSLSLNQEQGVLDIDQLSMRYPIEFQSSLSPGEKARLNILLVFENELLPVPRVIAFDEKQKMKFVNTVGITTEYPTEKYQLKVLLPSNKKPHSYTESPRPVVFSKKSVTYGPYSTIPNEPLSIHFESPKVGLIAPEWKRSVWIRNFGQRIELDELATLAHEGASLKDNDFNRFQFMEKHSELNQLQIVPKFPLSLPKSMAEFFFRDEIGNVSTSSITRRTSKGVIVELQPRFPLLGGWKYNWNHGYSLPGREWISFSPSDGLYVLEVPLYEGVPQIQIKELTLEVILPEGAIITKVQQNEQELELDRDYTFSTTWYYLDTRGRPSIIIQRSNVIEEMLSHPVRIEYKLPWLAFFQKPFAVFSFVVCIGFIVWGWNQLDFSVVKPKLRPHVRLGHLIQANLKNAKVDLPKLRNQLYSHLTELNQAAKLPGANQVEKYRAELGQSLVDSLLSQLEQRKEDKLTELRDKAQELMKL